MGNNQRQRYVIRKRSKGKIGDTKTIKGKDFVIRNEQSKGMVIRKRSKANAL
jgi:hypothetical protein